MKLVIFSKTPPPSKSKWADPNQSARGEWSEIYEAVTNWFCYSNGLRKELDLDIIINEEQTLRIHGNEIRYLAPPLRSAASLLWHGYNGKQPGINCIDSVSIEEYEKPYFIFSNEPPNSPSSKFILHGTFFLNPPTPLIEKLIKHGVTKIPALGHFNSQKLVWLLYP